MELVNYHDAEVVVIKSQNVDEASTYDGGKWVRHGGDTVLYEE